MIKYPRYETIMFTMCNNMMVMDEAKDLQNTQNASGTHPFPYSMGNQDSFHEGKAGQLPQCPATSKNEWS
jgi:hypothetical protein